MRFSLSALSLSLPPCRVDGAACRIPGHIGWDYERTTISAATVSATKAANMPAIGSSPRVREYPGLAIVVYGSIPGQLRASPLRRNRSPARRNSRQSALR